MDNPFPKLALREILSLKLSSLGSVPRDGWPQPTQTPHWRRRAQRGCSSCFGSGEGWGGAPDCWERATGCWDMLVNCSELFLLLVPSTLCKVPSALLLFTIDVHHDHARRDSQRCQDTSIACDCGAHVQSRRGGGWLRGTHGRVRLLPTSLLLER